MTRPSGPVMVASGCGGTGRELAAYADLRRPRLRHPLDHPRSPRRAGRRRGSWRRPAAWSTRSACRTPVSSTSWPPSCRGWCGPASRVFVSIAGSTMGEYADLARRLSRAPGVAGLEINIGAPDQAGEGLFDVREPYHAASVVAAVRREFPGDLPVLAKLRPDLSRIVEGARGVVDAGASAVVIGNAVPAAMPDGRPGGLTGPAIGPIALRCVAAVAGRASRRRRDRRRRHQHRRGRPPLPRPGREGRADRHRPVA